MDFGVKLRNGATVVAREGDYVLAHWEREFVTWQVFKTCIGTSETEDTAHGHYFPYHFGPSQAEALQQAVADLIERAK